ncbi:MAG TPA: hypothetical protein VK668_14850 [Mucilaginibacter sp.]|nr:hypothetical protein [Mucilaginibacter sp.]
MEFFERPQIRTVTPEKAVKILAKHGIILTIEKAKIMLDFMYKIGNLSVSQTLRKVEKSKKRRLRRIKTGCGTKIEHHENC